MRNIYETRDKVKMMFVVTSVVLVAVFIYISNSLMKSLEAEERSKIEIWAEATQQLASDSEDVDMRLVLKVIQSNTTIPVMIIDNDSNLVSNLNFTIPEDTARFIKKKVKELSGKGNIIEVIVSDDVSQFLYYDDSVLLKRLSYYPYIQLAVLLLFILLGITSFESMRQSEQNQLWVGLSKETAHQLGTPISSLMAWIEYLKAIGTESEITDEMNKDIDRLNTITERFSKIGSEPKLEEVDINEVIRGAVSYMQKRISSKSTLTLSLLDHPVMMDLSKPLFEWVIENMCKNSIDATGGHGNIKVVLQETETKVILNVEDDGKGILKKHFKTIFRAGYTTKKRGWGLGLTLVKRIVEEYHHGRIFVKESVPDTRTIISIELDKNVR